MIIIMAVMDGVTPAPSNPDGNSGSQVHLVPGRHRAAAKQTRFPER